MGLYGWDTSDYDWSRGLNEARIAQGAKEGIRFFSHKTTEAAPGQIFRHSNFGRAMKAAKAAGIPFLGGYVVPRTGVSVAQAGKIHLDFLDQQFPEWRTHPGFFHQVDLEFWGYDNVDLSYGTSLCDWLKHNGGNKGVLLYASGGHYGNGTISSYPRWNANYWLYQVVDDFRSLYNRSGGDNGPGWVPQGTRIWQYSDSAIIGGQNTCDANYFKGTEADFAKMIGAESVIVTPNHPEGSMAKYFDRGSVPRGYGQTTDGKTYTENVEMILIPPVGVHIWPKNGELAFASDWGPKEGVRLRVAIGTRTAWTDVKHVTVTGPFTSLILPKETARVAVCRVQRSGDSEDLSLAAALTPVAYTVTGFDD